MSAPDASSPLFRPPADTTRYRECGSCRSMIARADVTEPGICLSCGKPLEPRTRPPRDPSVQLPLDELAARRALRLQRECGGGS